MQKAHCFALSERELGRDYHSSFWPRGLRAKLEVSCFGQNNDFVGLNVRCFNVKFSVYLRLFFWFIMWTSLDKRKSLLSSNFRFYSFLLIEFSYIQFKHLVFTLLLYFIASDCVFIKSWNPSCVLVWLPSFFSAIQHLKVLVLKTIIVEERSKCNGERRR